MSLCTTHLCNAFCYFRSSSQRRPAILLLVCFLDNLRWTAKSEESKNVLLFLHEENKMGARHCYKGLKSECLGLSLFWCQMTYNLWKDFLEVPPWLLTLPWKLPSMWNSCSFPDWCSSGWCVQSRYHLIHNARWCTKCRRYLRLPCFSFRIHWNIV